MGPDVEKVVRVLTETEATLDGKLRSLPLFLELEAVRDLKRRAIAYLEGRLTPSSAEMMSVAPPTEDAPAQLPAVTRRQVREQSKTNIYKAVARQFFEQTGRRASSGAIVDLMVQRGIPVTDRKKEMGAVASALSGVSDFDNAVDARGSGYGLRVWSEQPPVNGQETGVVTAMKSLIGTISDKQAADPIAGPAA